MIKSEFKSLHLPLYLIFNILIAKAAYKSIRLKINVMLHLSIQVAHMTNYMVVKKKVFFDFSITSTSHIIPKISLIHTNLQNPSKNTG